MKAAGLKAIDTVIESTATLIKSKHPSNQKLVDKIASRISGVISEAIPSSPNYEAYHIQLHKNSSSANTTSLEAVWIRLRKSHPGNGHQPSRL